MSYTHTRTYTQKKTLHKSNVYISMYFVTGTYLGNQAQGPRNIIASTPVALSLAQSFESNKMG